MLVKSLLPFVLAAIVVNAAPVDNTTSSDVPNKPSPPSPLDVVTHLTGPSNKSATKQNHQINLPLGPRHQPQALKGKPEPEHESSPSLPVDPSSKLNTVKSHVPRDQDEDSETQAPKKNTKHDKPSSPLPIDPVDTVKSHAPRDSSNKSTRPEHAPTDKLPVNPVAIVAPRDDDGEVFAAKPKKPSSPVDKLPVSPLNKLSQLKSHVARSAKKPSKAAMPQLPPHQLTDTVSHPPRAHKDDKAASVQLPPAQVKEAVSHVPRDDEEDDGDNKDGEAEAKRPNQHQSGPHSPVDTVVNTVEKNAPVH